jgi:CBS domain-containing protein
MERTPGFEQYFDVRRQFEQHPWLMIGGAALAGVVAGQVATSLLRECASSTPSSSALGRSFRRSAKPMTEGRLNSGEPGREHTSFFSDLASKLEDEFQSVKDLVIDTFGGMAQGLAKQTLPESLYSKFAEMGDGSSRRRGEESQAGPDLGNGGSEKRRWSRSRLVRDIMTPDPVCCTRDTSLTDVARLMVEHDCGAIPVVQSNDNGRLVGVITDRDIVTRTLANGEDPFQMAAGDCMSSAPISVRPDTSLEDCAGTMEQHQLRRILVLDASGRCCGIVAQADLARHADESRTGDVVKNVSQSGEPAFGAL